MKKLLAALLIAAPLSAHAVPILTFNYANSGQTFGPSDTVTLLVEVINSGDTDYVGEINRSLTSGLIPYGFEFPPIGSVYASGTTTTIDFALYMPVAPVPAATYTSGPNSIRYIGLVGQNIVPLGLFTWTVGSPTSVPEPGTLTLFGAGLLAIVAMRRRRHSA